MRLLGARLHDLPALGSISQLPVDLQCPWRPAKNTDRHRQIISRGDNTRSSSLQLQLDGLGPFNGAAQQQVSLVPGGGQVGLQSGPGSNDGRGQAEQQQVSLQSLQLQRPAREQLLRALLYLRHHRVQHLAGDMPSPLALTSTEFNNSDQGLVELRVRLLDNHRELRISKLAGKRSQDPPGEEDSQGDPGSDHEQLAHRQRQPERIIEAERDQQADGNNETYPHQSTEKRGSADPPAQIAEHSKALLWSSTG